MAGSWIKAEKATISKPELFKMARILGISRYQVYGMLMHFWMWADDLTVDGSVDGIVDGDVDALVAFDGFAEALIQVGWLEQTRTNSKKPSINIPNFSRHMSESSKKRSVTSERQSRYRRKANKKHVDGSVDGDVDARPSTRASTREEKNKEEKKRKENLVFPYDSEEFKTAWKDYMESRKENKIKTTDGAKKLLIGRLNKLATNEAHAIALLNESTIRGWKSLFPIEQAYSSHALPDGKVKITKEVAEAAERRRRTGL